jgi:hypothetical protein
MVNGEWQEPLLRSRKISSQGSCKLDDCAANSFMTENNRNDKQKVKKTYVLGLLTFRGMKRKSMKSKRCSPAVEAEKWRQKDDLFLIFLPSYFCLNSSTSPVL